jgi:hypothetical protein
MELARSYEFWYRKKYNLTPTDPRFLETTAEQIEAEWWAYHYEDSTASVEFDDDDENAAEDYKAKIIREGEEAEAAARRDATIVEMVVDPATVDDWEEV